MSNIKTTNSFAEIADQIRVTLKARYPVLLRGRHGIGKSELVREIGKGLGEFCGIEGYKDLEVTEVRASQMNEGDILGLPVIDSKRGVTEFNPPVWFKEAMEEPRLLLFDEINRAVMEVKQQIFQITDSHRMDRHFLHPETRIIGAVNPADQYMVSEMDPAELDRWEVWDVDPSVEEWLKWMSAEKLEDGSKRIPDELIAFLSDVGEEFIELREGMFEPDTVYPSRRSWTRFADTYRIAKETHKDLSGDYVFTLALGFVNTNGALAFRDFIEDEYARIEPSDVIEDGKWEEATKVEVDQMYALIEAADRQEYFKEPLPYEQLCNWRKFMINVPQEAFITALIKMCHSKNHSTNVVQLGWSRQKKVVEDGEEKWVDDCDLPFEHEEEFHNYFYPFFEDDEAIKEAQAEGKDPQSVKPSFFEKENIDKVNERAEKAYKEQYGEDEEEETSDKSEE